MRGINSNKGRVITIYCKIHKTTDGTVFAVCDKEIAGKKLEDGELEFFVSEKFYREKEISEKELRKKLKTFDNINLIGNKAVKVAIEEKLVDEKSIVKIQGIPHAQVFRL